MMSATSKWLSKTMVCVHREGETQTETEGLWGREERGKEEKRGKGKEGREEGGRKINLAKN